MTGLKSRRSTLWISLGSVFGFSLILALPGCGGSETGSGDANYTQKFEDATGPAVATKPARERKPNARDLNDLNPRERRAQKESQ